MVEIANERLRGFLIALLLTILPWVLIIMGLILPIENAWYYILNITWFATGLIFYYALR